MDSISTDPKATRLVDAENARAEARGMAFLIGMAAVGALVVVATLGFATAPSGADATPTGNAVSTR